MIMHEKPCLIPILKLALISVLCDGSSAVLSRGSETLQLLKAFKGCSRPVYNFLSSSRGHRDLTFFVSILPLENFGADQFSV